MRSFRSIGLVFAAMVVAVAFSGCSLLGGCGSEPALQVRSPVALVPITQSTQLPPASQQAVFAAPVAPVAATAAYAAPAAGAVCAPYDVAPEPVMSYKRTYQREK